MELNSEAGLCALSHKFPQHFHKMKNPRSGWIVGKPEVTRSRKPNIWVCTLTALDARESQPGAHPTQPVRLRPAHHAGGAHDAATRKLRNRSTRPQ